MFKYVLACNDSLFSESSDFQLETTMIHVPRNANVTVRINLMMDNVALEPNETVRLRLVPTSQLETGEILLDTFDITIRDTDSKLSYLCL